MTGQARPPACNTLSISNALEAERGSPLSVKQCPDTIFLGPGTLFLVDFRTVGILGERMSQSERKAKRRSKKTEALEIRLSPEEKTAFLDACTRAGRTASAVIRDAMRAYAQFGPMARLPGSPIMIASAFIGASAGAFLLVQATQPAEGSEEARLYGYRTFSSYAGSGPYDSELTLDEYLQRSYSVRETLDQLSMWEADPSRLDPRDRETLPGRAGRVFGLLFIPSNLDPDAFGTQPERVSASCWAAMDAVRREALTRVFSSWDADGNGVVTAREYSNSIVARSRHTFDSLDVSGDGMLTVADFDPAQMQAAHSRDTEAGEAQPPRLRLAGTACQDERGWAVRAAPAPEAFVHAGEDRDPPPYNSAEGTIRAFDLDGSGAVSFAEYLAASGL